MPLCESTPSHEGRLLRCTTLSCTAVQASHPLSLPLDDRISDQRNRGHTNTTIWFPLSSHLVGCLCTCSQSLAADKSVATFERRPCQTLHLTTDISLYQAKTTTSSCDKALQIFDTAVVVESVEEILGYLRRVWLWRTSTTSLEVWQRLCWMRRPGSATLYALKKLHWEETTYEQSSKPARRALSCWSPTGAEVWCL